MDRRKRKQRRGCTGAIGRWRIRNPPRHRRRAGVTGWLLADRREPVLSGGRRRKHGAGYVSVEARIVESRRRKDDGFRRRRDGRHPELVAAATRLTISTHEGSGVPRRGPICLRPV